MGGTIDSIEGLKVQWYGKTRLKTMVGHMKPHGRICSVLGPSSNGQVRNCTFYPEAPPVCPVQLKCASGKLHVSVVIDTNVILGTQRRGGVERASVSHETGWGVGIFDMLFSPHSIIIS